jgi:hypothetical protein
VEKFDKNAATLYNKLHMENNSDYVSVRVPKNLLEEIKELIPTLAEDPVVKATGVKLSSAMAVRLTLLKGIDAIQKRGESKNE